MNIGDILKQFSGAESLQTVRSGVSQRCGNWRIRIQCLTTTVGRYAGGCASKLAWGSPRCPAILFAPQNLRHSTWRSYLLSLIPFSRDRQILPGLFPPGHRPFSRFNPYLALSLPSLV